MRRRQGSVLILALWSLFFLGALALAVAGYVSAALDSARFLKNEAIAHHLAKAGVEKAVAMVLEDPSQTTNAALLASAFLDQSLEGMGTFSVTFLSMSNDSGGLVIVTNAGITAFGVNERSRDRVNIDWSYGITRTQMVSLGIAPEVVENILNYAPETASKRTVEKDSERSYGSHFGSVQELLAVEGVGWREFALLEPFATIDRYKWHRVGETRTALSSYGGSSEGRVEVTLDDGSREVIASSRIAFVLVTNGAGNAEFLYWREH